MRGFIWGYTLSPRINLFYALQDTQEPRNLVNFRSAYFHIDLFSKRREIGIFASIFILLLRSLERFIGAAKPYICFVAYIWRLDCINLRE